MTTVAGPSCSLRSACHSQWRDSPAEAMQDPFRPTQSTSKQGPLRFTGSHSDSLSLLQIPSSDFSLSQSHSVSLLLVCHSLTLTQSQPDVLNLGLSTQSYLDSLRVRPSHIDLLFSLNLAQVHSDSFGLIRIPQINSSTSRFTQALSDSCRPFQSHSKSHTLFQIHRN